MGTDRTAEIAEASKDLRSEEAKTYFKKGAEWADAHPCWLPCTEENDPDEEPTAVRYKIGDEFFYCLYPDYCRMTWGGLIRVEGEFMKLK